MDPDVGDRPPVAAPRHRAQDVGAPLGRGIVGEDVVALVAAAAAEPADFGALAVAVLQLRLGRAGGGDLLEVLLVVLGQPEVDEGAVPGVAEGHSAVWFACRGHFPASKTLCLVEPRAHPHDGGALAEAALQVQQDDSLLVRAYTGSSGR